MYAILKNITIIVQICSIIPNRNCNKYHKYLRTVGTIEKTDVIIPKMNEKIDPLLSSL